MSKIITSHSHIKFGVMYMGLHTLPGTFRLAQISQPDSGQQIIPVRCAQTNLYSHHKSESVITAVLAKKTTEIDSRDPIPPVAFVSHRDSYNTFTLVEYKNGFKKLSIDLPATIVQQRDDACENVARTDRARERPDPSWSPTTSI